MIRMLWVALFLTLGAADVAAREIDADRCARCHDEADWFLDGPHGRAMNAVDETIGQRSCEACHGPGDTHRREETVESIIGRPGSEACVTCHAEQEAESSLHMPAHDRTDIACTDCHDSGHGEPRWTALLHQRPYELCGDCHRPQQFAARLPFSHREGSRPFECTECHASHQGAASSHLLVEARNAICTDCHFETRGPFVFAHDPVEVEGCESCHEPHGSPNPRLLTRRSSGALCLECHAGVPAFHDMTDPKYRACASCHNAVHGSNRDPKLFDH